MSAFGLRFQPDHASIIVLADDHFLSSSLSEVLKRHGLESTILVFSDLKSAAAYVSGESPGGSVDAIFVDLDAYEMIGETVSAARIGFHAAISSEDRVARALQLGAVLIDGPIRLQEDSALVMAAILDHWFSMAKADIAVV